MSDIEQRTVDKTIKQVRARMARQDCLKNKKRGVLRGPRSK